MKKPNIVIDIAKCHGCHNCFIACKDEHWNNDHLPYSVSTPRHGHRWINVFYVERGQFPQPDVAYLPHPCMHCDSPPCMKVGGDAIYKRPDGIVIIDPVKAKGRKEIVSSCPYKVIFWNEEKQIAQKCTMCAHLLDQGWKEPRCVQSCPTGALTFLALEDSEMAKIQKDQQLEYDRPGLRLNGRVCYKNLYRFTKCHVAGTVALAEDDECAEGAEVVLTDLQSKQAYSTMTNNYGDFKFDNLAPNSGQYQLKVIRGGEKQVREFELKDSVNLGTIWFPGRRN